ncbi:aminoglycoside 6'-N-acetyltransferase [Stenotrophomonas sp. TWI143]|uniref:aminoglycoside 6'-N-acetyltransferase n=1 Tax=Stenotrophomonas TaxID=40323 RepID=UPI0021C8740E|nr:aminoglycoside 6'-N-acetyltransferase [Stenotrophomonas maltophilia]MCU1091840.1 aminoglycoside 6'-N-acetyltransferase [Stenotrophomonas maltophilia]MDZ5841511.1 aminoglycoside 6'-N-acetyltransferase [Stenotrophomonas maltophilia]HEL5053692.1 aminoglycoside 6'-N-acetyltransferase [Stenotrophomonas maltophilia]HEL5056109.1 aminoglycoside 6'-N-acetyltransferase [Stenotrophomonas maltophilia]
MSGCAATIRQATPADAAAWSQLRVGLWPDADDPLEELAQSLADPEGAVFLACAADGEAVGFAEVRLRHDYVNGTGSSPVGFLEGWYVTPQWQGRAVGRALLAEVQAWTRDAGCSELASDSRLEDVEAHAAHRACGFVETERVVYFRMPLDAATRG